MHLSLFFFCIILLCIISCSDLNGTSVDDCIDDDSGDDSFIQSSIICSHLRCKIRFEALKRQRGRERGEKKVRVNTDILTQLKDELQVSLLLIYEQLLLFFWKE